VVAGMDAVPSELGVMDDGCTPLLLRAADAAALCDTSLRTWRTWDVAGKIPQPIRIGRSLRWRASELHAWIAAGCPDRSTWQAMQN
jgi:predicted DNA-binding transcriptional regulator AlpA